MLTWTQRFYDVALPRPIVTAHGTYSRRAGFILSAHTPDGIVGVGDVAPLPGFSRESVAAAAQQWEAVRPQLVESHIPRDANHLGSFLDTLSDDDVLCPSLRFGIETAIADVSSRLAGIPMCLWLADSARTEIDVNALLHQQEPDELLATFRERWNEGFRCFKIKVGVGDVASDIRRVRALRAQSPEARIRPDANAGWTVEQLTEFCEGCADLSLEFIEQPLAVGMAEVAREITRPFGIRLALDEDISGVSGGEQALANDLCDVIVLKPMTIGGLTPCLTLADTAHAHDAQIVLTSSWESDVGVAATAHLAAACADTAAVSGLSTAGMIAAGLVHPALDITNGRIVLSPEPGLGVSLVDTSGHDE